MVISCHQQCHHTLTKFNRSHITYITSWQTSACTNHDLCYKYHWHLTLVLKWKKLPNVLLSLNHMPLDPYDSVFKVGGSVAFRSIFYSHIIMKNIFFKVTHLCFKFTHLHVLFQKETHRCYEATCLIETCFLCSLKISSGPAFLAVVVLCKSVLF